MSELSLFAVPAALLGAIAGSFLNALSFRFNTGRSIVRGRSACMHCGHTLSVFDLVPLLSYLLLFGKCRYCGTRLSVQYPLVESVAAALSFGVYTIVGFSFLFLFWLLVWMVILFIVVYDLRHMVIPWSCSLVLMALAFGHLFLDGMPSYSMLLAGPVLAFPLLLLSLLSRGRWMGWGDGIFELSIGWLLGLLPGLSALVCAIWSGAVVGVVLVLFSQLSWKYRPRGFTMKSELPFAPFLALGAVLVYFFHVELFSSIPSLW